MGYRIDYQHHTNGRARQCGISGRIALTTVFFALFLMGTTVCWPEGRDILRQLLFTGAGAAASAWEQLVSGLDSGAPIGEALSVFGQALLK